MGLRLMVAVLVWGIVGGVVVDVDGSGVVESLGICQDCGFVVKVNELDAEERKFVNEVGAAYAKQPDAMPTWPASFIRPDVRTIRLKKASGEDIRVFVRDGERISDVAERVCGRLGAGKECGAVEVIRKALYPFISLARVVTTSDGGVVTGSLTCRHGEAPYNCAKRLCEGREDENLCTLVMENDADALGRGVWRSEMPGGVSGNAALGFAPLDGDRDRDRFFKRETEPIPSGAWSRYWLLARALEDELLGVGYAVYDGHTGSCPRKISDFIRFALGRYDIKHVCEIGYNAGHSALAWLSMRSDVRVTAFEIGVHSYSRASADFLNSWFDNRLEMVWGDSTETVPAYKNASSCDLWFVDGGHSYIQVLADLVHISQTKDTTLAILDDFACSMTHCRGTRNAVYHMMTQRRLEELQITFSTDNSVNLVPNPLERASPRVLPPKQNPPINQLHVPVTDTPYGLDHGLAPAHQPPVADTIVNGMAIVRLFQTPQPPKGLFEHQITPGASVDSIIHQYAALSPQERAQVIAREDQ